MAEEPKVGPNRGNAGKGRPKGSVNKTTALLKDAILKAAANAGNGDMVAYLEKQAAANPGPFLSLLGKVLPMQVSGMGEDGSHLTEITFRVVDGNPRD